MMSEESSLERVVNKAKDDHLGTELRGIESHNVDVIGSPKWWRQEIGNKLQYISIQLYISSEVSQELKNIWKEIKDKYVSVINNFPEKDAVDEKLLTEINDIDENFKNK